MAFRSPKGSISRVCAAALLALVPACDSATGLRPDAQPCRQTYEFGNTGCAEIAGRVIDAQDQGRAGISVGPRYLTGANGFNTPYATTDTAGRFRLRITRFAGMAPAAGPDTVSLYVHAADPRSAGLERPATLRDSVLVQVTISLLDEVPAPIDVTIRLVER